MKHLAIFSKGVGDLILSGKKSIESRFSKSKIAPFGAVSAGDLIYIKPSGEEIIGQFRVKKVIFYDGLNREDILKIKEEFGQQILADETYWQSRLNCKYGTLIFIGDSSRFITAPFKYPKKDLRGWVVLNGTKN